MRTGLILLLIAACARVCARAGAPADYAAVQQILSSRCLDCHASQEPEARLVLESYDDLMKGGEHGAAVVPGRSGESLLLKMIEGQVERDGKRKIMPPGKREKLTPDEIAAVRSWIDSGAKPPAPGTALVQDLVVPKIKPRVAPRRSIHALACAPTNHLVAVGRYGEVELLSAESRSVLRTLKTEPGAVNALAFSRDGKSLFAGGGEAGRFGIVYEFSVPDGKQIRMLRGHKDAIYALALAPDGRVLATGSYDQKIKLWNPVSGSEIRTLSGHNGAIYDLAFRPDGKILASGSADRTVKLWDVSTGERRDTLSQSLKEIYAVAFSADGKRLFAGGADNRIREWEVSEKALETTNPILDARFAHEGAILKLALSGDGHTLASIASDGGVKLWDAARLEEKLALEQQPDWPSAVAFLSDDRGLLVGRVDGTLQFYGTSDGKVLPPPKPVLARVEPRGLQRGTTARLKLIGTNLVNLTGVSFADARIKAELAGVDDGGPGEAWVSVTTPADLPRGAYELSVQNANGESGNIKLHLDDLPQLYVRHGKDRNAEETLARFPVSIWSTHEQKGQTEAFHFHAEAGQTLLFDAAAKSLGSKAVPVLTLFDNEGQVLQSSNGFDASSDPLLVFQAPAPGEYRLQVAELVLGASVDHFYRLSAGSFPYVTGCFPLSVAVGQESEVELIGYNLPSAVHVKVHPEAPGEIALPLDGEKFRSRRDFKLIASTTRELVEAEPNDTPAQATSVQPPCSIGGRIWARNGSADVDLFRFDAKAGEKWIIETAAAQLGSPADTKVEVLSGDGKPVERLRLQAVRDSSVTFRGIDSDTSDCRVVNWEEMELNQYLYMQGEVVKLFRAPQGPDSGFVFYNLHGKRRCYFDTSPAAHALDEPCYIVEPHAPGSKLVPNGLPVFPLYYANDDDAEREAGTDSRLHFTAPADGAYLVRVGDTRGFEGDRYAYRLVLRKPEPDFHLVLKGTNLTVNAGSGQAFSIVAERTDEFDGEIQVTLDHLPPGYQASTPLVIEAGHTEAQGTIHASVNAHPASGADWSKVEVTASAVVEGRPVVKAVNNFGVVKLAEKPKLFVSLTPDPSATREGRSAADGLVSPSPLDSQRPLEITIAPGQTVPAVLHIQRNGHDDLVTFTVENLPHGVIVDNIGLNGVLIPKGQNERQIFLSAARWVPETDRLCFAVESQAGRQTSLPILLHVRRTSAPPATAQR